MEKNKKIALLPLQLQYCEEVYAIAKESLPEHWSLAGIQDVLKYKNNLFFVAIETNGLTKHILSEDDTLTEMTGIVGFIGIMVIDKEAELLNIAVRPKYRRQGIAEQLLERGILAAKENTAERMLLEVRQSNTAAQQLYAKYQFSVIGKRKNYYQNPNEDALIMEKRLGE